MQKVLVELGETAFVNQFQFTNASSSVFSPFVFPRPRIRANPMSKAANAAKQGRASSGKAPGVPDYLPLENLAVASAAIAASVKPNKQIPELETDTGKAYATCLQDHSRVHGWPDVNRPGQFKHEKWTIELSSTIRGAAGNLWTRWLRTILPECTKLTADLARWYNQDGTVPSGQGPDDAKAFVLDVLWKRTQVIDVDPPAPVAPADTTEPQPAASRRRGSACAIRCLRE